MQENQDMNSNLNYFNYSNNQGAQKSTDILAILSLISIFVYPLVGIILGHISLIRIHKGMYSGETMVKVSLIINYIFTVIQAIFSVIVIMWIIYIILIDYGSFLYESEESGLFL